MTITCPDYYHHSFVCDYYNYGVSQIATGGDNRCECCLACCYPCSCVADLLCFVPMCFGCYKVSKADINTDYSNRCKYGPRFPYTFTGRAFDYCCIGCDKPGPPSPAHDPSNNSCDDFALCCLPCTLTGDILCCVPMTFGCFTVEKPK